ncbi:MAG TPA: lytic transglycosylase domain-containing protein [Xanthobacteraceae bacterium]|jgi:hypothetical protein
MTRVPAISLLVLALSAATAFAGFSPIRNDTPESGSVAQQANSASDWNEEADSDTYLAEAADPGAGDSASTGYPGETSDVSDADDKASANWPDGVCDALVASAQANGLPVAFFSNLIWQESRFHPDAVSRAGALGIAQFMPKTAAAVGLDDPLDPAQALPASARLLANLNHEFGNLGLAAAAYNAGGKRVTDWLSKGTTLPKETRNYVLTITGHPVEQWSPSSSQNNTFALARKMPCRGVESFATVVTNEGTNLDETAPVSESGVPVRQSQSVRQNQTNAWLAQHEALVRRIAAVHVRWAPGHEHSQPIRVAEISSETTHRSKAEHVPKRRRS